MKAGIRKPIQPSSKIKDLKKISLSKKQLSRLKGGDGDFIGIEDVINV